MLFETVGETVAGNSIFHCGKCIRFQFHLIFKKKFFVTRQRKNICVLPHTAEAVL